MKQMTRSTKRHACEHCPKARAAFAGWRRLVAEVGLRLAIGRLAHQLRPGRMRMGIVGARGERRGGRSLEALCIAGPALAFILRRVQVFAILAFPILGCERKLDENEGLLVEVGVFFGGQIQQLEQVRYSQISPPHLGFRLTRSGASQQRVARNADHAATRVRFDLVVPGPAGRRVTKMSEMRWSLEQGSVDQLLDVPEQAGYGVWNVRIVHEGVVLADRALHVMGP